MAAKTYHFRVGNGDMTLIKLESGRNILIDMRIRGAADNPDDDTPDVGAQLRALLPRDAWGRLHVHAVLLTHPDADHICGLINHFHLGPPEDWSSKTDKILIDEMWSSPIVFRRGSADHVLCADAKAWCKEARRRVALYRAGFGNQTGDQILVLGEDIEGKTDDLDDILVRTGERFSRIGGIWDTSMSTLLLAPLPPADDEEEKVLSKNDSSVIIQMTISADGKADAARYVIGGDAGVAIWERIWDRYGGQPADLEYDVLIPPHHCSWRSLSYDSWSEKREKAEVAPKARSALGQARTAAVVLSSSCPVEDDDNDPPCIRAKREYVSIVKPKGGEFRCVSDGASDDPFIFEISWGGPRMKRLVLGAGAAASTGIGSEALAHG